MLIGLDKSLSIKEIIQEVYNKIKSNVGSLSQKNMMVIDNESILSKKKENIIYIKIKS